MATETNQSKLNKLINLYKGKPITFIRTMFKVTPTKQQIDFINLAVKQDARVACKSCTSSGKTAAICWLTFYFLLTHKRTKGIVLAPSAPQVYRVFKSELHVWYDKMPPTIQSFFEIMNDRIYMKGKKDSQFVSWATASAEQKESFAGLHAKKVLIFVDEASALDTDIYDTLYGTLSSGDTSFCLISNPVRAVGSFYDIFQVPEDKKIFDTLTFSAYDSPNVNKKWIEETKASYGKDSDFYKMRVLGEFPVLGEAQFIQADVVDNARATTLMPIDYHHYPRILGVDVARFGDDSSVILDRQGPKIHEILAFKKLDTVAFSEKVIEYYRGVKSIKAVAVDGIGIGAGVVDQLKRFGLPVIDVNVSTKSSEPKSYFNLRAQLYGYMKEWLSTADIPYNEELRDQLVGINYSYNNKLQIILESKKDMKKRGMSSPDIADALSLTFATQTFQYSPNRVQARKIRISNTLWA